MPEAAELFDGPVQLMLSRAQDTIPQPSALAGGTVWEPKWDGYRCVLRVGKGQVSIWSRNNTNLSTTFPDLITAATTHIPPGVVLDGEAVVWVDGRLSFDHLQHRMTTRSPVLNQTVRQHPASYVAFDILAVDNTDVRGLAWRDRRTLLEELAAGFAPPLELSPYTDDYATAQEWFTALSAAGVEGLVAKGAGTRYRPGERGWVKIKHRQVVDAIIGATIGPITRPDAIVVGRYTPAGELRIVGRSVALTSAQAEELAAALTPVNPAAAHPWPDEIGAGHFGAGKASLNHVAPELVVEVAADSSLQAGRHRHGLRLIRLRPDLRPGDITTDS